MGLLSEKIERYVEVGQTIVVNLLWRGQLYRLQMFFPGAKFPTRQEVTKQVQGIYPNAVVQTVSPTTTDPTKPTIRVAKEGWSAKYKKSIDMAEEKDHEVSMAHSQLDKTIDNAKKLKKKLGSKEKNLPAWVQAKITDTDHNMDAASSYTEDVVNEEGLRDWFGKSKSKDGKKGWVNVVTGDSCASDKPGEGIPKCVSSAKRASMSKKERRAAAAAKRREDPGQQKKSGASAPTMVKTDRKTRKEEMEVNEAKDKPGKGSGKKDACYTKVKSRYSVWPSAYASGALVKCRKVGAANWGNSKKEDYTYEFNDEYYDTLFEKCWKGYVEKGMKKKGDRMVPNCVPVKEERLDEEEYDRLKDKKLGGYTDRDDDKDVEELDSIANRIKAIRQGIKSDAEKKKQASKKPTTQMAGYEPEGEQLQEKPGDGYLGPTPIPNPIRLAQDAVDATNRKSAEKVRRINKILPGSASMPKHTYFNKGPSAASQRYLGLKNSFELEGELIEQKATYNQRIGRDPSVPSHLFGGDANVRGSLERRFRGLSVQDRRSFKGGGGYARMDKSGETMPQVIDRGRAEQKRLSSKMVNTANWTDDQGRKVYAGNPPMRFNLQKNSYEPEGEVIDEKSAAWTRKAGKNKEGGLNEKGRKSYERENPGSDLKAPSKKVGNKRRSSFCARMKGMKKKLTSKKTANDPNSRINKSLRAWNC